MSRNERDASRNAEAAPDPRMVAAAAQVWIDVLRRRKEEHPIAAPFFAWQAIATATKASIDPPAWSMEYVRSCAQVLNDLVSRAVHADGGLSQEAIAKAFGFMVEGVQKGSPIEAIRVAERDWEIALQVYHWKQASPRSRRKFPRRSDANAQISSEMDVSERQVRRAFSKYGDLVKSWLTAVYGYADGEIFAFGEATGSVGTPDK